MTRLHETASQTAGPYVHIGLAPALAGIDVGPAALGGDVAGPNARGPRIKLEGMILDGLGHPVRDGVVEAWQANAEGVHAHPLDPNADRVEPGFRGWGRAPVDPETGLWRFETVKPGRVPDPRGLAAAPHVALWIVARGINLGLLTRLYFEDEGRANAEDSVLAACGPRAGTLIAAQPSSGLYRLDIRLQGDGETVFFDV